MTKYGLIDSLPIQILENKQTKKTTHERARISLSWMCRSVKPLAFLGDPFHQAFLHMFPNSLQQLLHITNSVARKTCSPAGYWDVCCKASINILQDTQSN